MNPLTRKLATAGSALAFAATSLLLASSPASAATSCYGSSCNGLDPAATICQNDAQTVMWGEYVALELRYSPTCRAAWARFKNGDEGEIWVQNSLGNKYAVHYPGSGTVWTRMVNDKDILAMACGTFAKGTACTPEY
ncbi:DUF2690 domain-containing protein [Streptomyces sp. NPDC005828]|uniref:DUF2690 domain-containing protein n=1 Tax=Streptomyces sp. NPDC005828 TaxID=3157071 RepID=UPI003406734B